MNVEIKSTAFASSYLEHLNEVIAQCQTITHKSLKKEIIIYLLVLYLYYWLYYILLIFHKIDSKNFTDLSVCFLVLVSTDYVQLLKVIF
jgi:hypothetical protein